MNKLEITKKLAEQSEHYNSDPKFVGMLYKAWWVNWRNSEDRRFRLTDNGYEYFTVTAEIKFYEIRFPIGLVITNKMIIDLDRYIDCPYYITSKSIMLTGEKSAVQLVLFDGDLTKFGRAKDRTRQKKQKNS
jgi:hypothetical protein